jgi:Cap4 dsDNA endonuclease
VWKTAKKLFNIPQEQQGMVLKKDMDSIHDNTPRETAGRETILRFRMQFQAAAYAALEILSGSEVDRVYCDYHDDFVVRRSSSAGVNYHFFQVKTKDRLNKQWTLLEIFALRKRGAIGSGEKLKEVRDSIAGKLFAHTITFGDQCSAVTILSNVHFDDAVLNAIAGLQAGDSEEKQVAELIERFGEIFAPDHDLTPEALKSARVKLGVVPAVDHIGESLDRFTSEARTAIWKHSEIDLRPQEVDEIARSLVDMVTSKSCARIAGLSKQQLEQATSVGLKDLLEVLSISTPVYETLRSGEDPKAIKSASILQRQLKQAGASDSMVETASRLKVEWDVWLRTSRHVYTEMALESLLQEVETTCSNWLLAGGRLADLQKLLSALFGQQLIHVFKTLNEDLLFGAVLAAMVRRGAR